MKLTVFLLSAILSTAIFAQDNNNSSTNNKQISINAKKEGLAYIKKLSSTLKSQLQEHMQVDPTGVAALGFCTAKAMEVTADINKELPSYAKVRRTALRTRNKANTPDTIDIKIMNEYVDAIEKKKFSPDLIKVFQEGNTTRVYKPLVTEGVCLKCHGENISKELHDMILSSYPEDNATGFKEGELRGVIVAEIVKTTQQ